MIKAAKSGVIPKKLIHSIVHGDCLEKLPKIPDNFVDFVCADFPYNISGKPGLTMRGNKVVRADFGEWDKWPSQDAYLDFVFEVCRQLHRVMKPNASAVLFFGYRQMGWIAYELERRGLFTFRQPIVWRKANPLPSFKQNGFRSCMETGVWLVKDGGDFHRPKTFNFLGQDKMTSIWPYKIGIDGGKASKHPTEKPL